MQAVSTKNMTRDEWLAIRRTGIGGSDAAAVLGQNPYVSPLRVYCDKLALLPQQDETEAMRQGRDLEQYVAERFMERTGKKVRRDNHIIWMPGCDWMYGNIDRRVVGENAGLECKTTSPYNKTEFDQGDVPAPMYWQCQQYMAVTGCERWYLAVLVLNVAFHIFEIERNEDHITYLRENASRFWWDHVQAQVPPLPTGTERDDEIVSILTDNAILRPGVLNLSELDGDINMMMTIKSSIDALGKQYDAIHQRIELAMEKSEEARSDRYRLTYRMQTTNRIDTKLLRSELPDIAAKYTKGTKSRTLRVKEA